MKVYAIIPARSLSKGLPNKNILEIGGKPLLAHSIDFAKKLPSVTRILCSTDSCEYSRIAQEFGAEVPFLRSPEAASDEAMEEDILRDLRRKMIEHKVEEPDIVVWLRPTFVFRSVEDVEKCVGVLKTRKSLSAARTVTKSENRLYHIESNQLVPAFNDRGKSMIRRQDMKDSFRVFSTDVFRFKDNDFNDDFLGSNVFAVETNKICGLDIDDRFDFELVKCVLERLTGFVRDYI